MPEFHYVHLKTGGAYVIEAVQKMASDLPEGRIFWDYTVTDTIESGAFAVMYRNAVTEERWMRPAEMFFDGRFKRVPIGETPETGVTPA